MRRAATFARAQVAVCHWFNPNLLKVARRAWSAAMLFEAVIGCGSLNPCRLLADYLLACQPGHRRPCGEWLKRGLRCRKLVCPHRFELSRGKERLVLVAVTRKSDDRVVVAVDPHKASWTAAAVDGSLQPLVTVRVPVSRDGYRALRRFAQCWPHARWAIEGAAGLGAPLTTLLRTDGIEVIDVPAKLAARVRVLSSGHGRKNDDADALSVGIAALTSPALGTANETIIMMTAMMSGAGTTMPCSSSAAINEYVRLGADSDHAAVRALALGWQSARRVRGHRGGHLFVHDLRPLGIVVDNRAGVGCFGRCGVPGRRDAAAGHPRTSRATRLDRATTRSHHEFLAALGNTDCAPASDPPSRQPGRAGHVGSLRVLCPLQLGRKQDPARFRGKQPRICGGGSPFSVELHHSPVSFDPVATRPAVCG
jgi:hypothetical protein